MIDTKLRKFIQPGFDLSAKLFINLGFKPNHLTVLGFFFGVLTAVLVIIEQNIFALLAISISGYFDVIDGTVARITVLKSDKGAFLDIVFDRLVESLFIISLAIAYPENYMSYLIFLVLLIFNFTTFLLAGKFVENKSEKSMHYDPGIAERSETFLCFGLILVFPQYIFYILNFFNLLILITGTIRFRNVLKLLK